MSESKRKEYVRQASRTLVPQFYAAMAMAIKRSTRLGKNKIVSIFEATRAIWEEYGGRADELVRDCCAETGIQIVHGDEPQQGS